MSVYRKKLVLNIILISFFVAGSLFLNGNSGEVKADTDEVYENIEIFRVF